MARLDKYPVGCVPRTGAVNDVAAINSCLIGIAVAIFAIATLVRPQTTVVGTLGDVC